MVTPTLPSDLSDVLAHARACYPREACGLIVRLPGGFQFHPMENVYDKYHRLDPERFPRDSRTAYKMNELAVTRIVEQAEAQGGQVACVFHSHCDVGAYFSKEDREVAAPDGQPLWPGVSYLVVAIDQGQATAARLFWWRDGDFAEAEVTLRR